MCGRERFNNVANQILMPKGFGNESTTSFDAACITTACAAQHFGFPYVGVTGRTEIFKRSNASKIRSIRTFPNVRNFGDIYRRQTSLRIYEASAFDTKKLLSSPKFSSKAPPPCNAEARLRNDPITNQSEYPFRHTGSDFWIGGCCGDWWGFQTGRLKNTRYEDLCHHSKQISMRYHKSRVSFVLSDVDELSRVSWEAKNATIFPLPNAQVIVSYHYPKKLI